MKQKKWKGRRCMRKGGSGNQNRRGKTQFFGLTPFDVDTDTQSATFNLTSSYKGTVPVSIHQCLCVLGSHHTAMNSDLVQRVPVPRVPTAPHRANSATAVSSRKHVPQSILKRYSTVSNSDGLRFMYGIGN